MSFTAFNQANYVRRRTTSAVMNGLCVGAAILGLIVLSLILYTLLSKGLHSLSLDVFVKPMRTQPQGAGLGNAIVGSLIQVGMGIVMGAPLGIAAGVFLSEHRGARGFAAVVRFVNDILLTGPSVLIGLFVYQIVVLPMHHNSGFAGAVALALLAMPVVARTTEDIVKLVPDSYRDASIALGARESTSVTKVILPAAFGGILTGVLLAVARIAGETAPLIFTSLGSYYWPSSLTERAMASLPMAIYQYAKDPSPELQSLAWTGALIITFGVLILNVLSRAGHFFISRGKSR